MTSPVAPALDGFLTFGLGGGGGGAVVPPPAFVGITAFRSTGRLGPSPGSATVARPDPRAAVSYWPGPTNQAKPAVSYWPGPNDAAAAPLPQWPDPRRGSGEEF